MAGGQAGSAVTLRRDLTEAMSEIEFNQIDLHTDRILPPINVAEVAGNYPVIPREAKMKIPDTKRAPDGTYVEGSWEWTQATYTTQEYGFAEPVDNVDNLRWSDYVDQEQISAEIARNSLLLAREKRTADRVQDTAVFTGAANTLAITNEWDDDTNAVPWSDVNAGFIQLRGKTGFAKNRMSLILTDDVFNYALRTDEVVASVQYTEAVVTMSPERKSQFLAEYFGVKEIITTSNLYDTTGLQLDATIGKLWSNEYGMLAVLSSGIQSFKEPSLGRRIVWKKYATDMIMESYERPDRNQTVIRAREYNGIIINVDFGFLFSNMKTTVSNGI